MSANQKASEKPLVVSASDGGSWGGIYHGYVMQGSKVVASCHHYHRTYAAGIRCAQKMKRKAER